MDYLSGTSLNSLKERKQKGERRKENAERKRKKLQTERSVVTLAWYQAPPARASAAYGLYQGACFAASHAFAL